MGFTKQAKKKAVRDKIRWAHPSRHVLGKVRTKELGEGVGGKHHQTKLNARKTKLKRQKYSKASNEK